MKWKKNPLDITRFQENCEKLNAVKNSSKQVGILSKGKQTQVV